MLLRTILKINKKRRRFGGEIRAHGGEERLRARRKRVRMISLSIGSVCGLVFVVAIAWGSHQPRFQIAEIAVVGNKSVPSAEISDTAESVIRGQFHLFSTSNAFLFPRRRVEDAVMKAFPRIERVRVSILSIQERSIELQITERVPYARWCGTSGCYLLDERGFIFARDDESSPVRDEIFEGGMIHEDTDMMSRYFLPSYFSEVSRATRLIEREGVNVIRISVENEHDFHLTLANGATLFARFRDEPAAIAERFKLAIQSEALAGKIGDLEYIDLRYPNRIYYKFK